MTPCVLGHYPHRPLHLQPPQGLSHHSHHALHSYAFSSLGATYRSYRICCRSPRPYLLLSNTVNQKVSRLIVSGADSRGVWPPPCISYMGGFSARVRRGIEVSRYTT